MACIQAALATSSLGSLITNYVDNLITISANTQPRQLGDLKVKSVLSYSCYLSHMYQYRFDFVELGAYIMMNKPKSMGYSHVYLTMLVVSFMLENAFLEQPAMYTRVSMMPRCFQTMRQAPCLPAPCEIKLVSGVCCGLRQYKSCLIKQLALTQ